MTVPTIHADTIADDVDTVKEEQVDPPRLDVVPVQIIAEPQSETAAADKATWNTYQINGDGSTGQFQLLGQQRKRHKAQIIVNGTAGDFIRVGSRRQAGNASVVGARIYVGNIVPIESASELMCLANFASTSTNPIFVTVVEELYL